jgi:hypothetical protein
MATKMLPVIASDNRDFALETAGIEVDYRGELVSALIKEG